MNRKAALLVIAVFLLGMAIGALGFYAFSKGSAAAGPGAGKHGREGSVARLTAELGLSPQQQEQLRSILGETQSQYDALYSPVRPQAEAIRQQGRQKIRAMLTPEQLPRFEEYLRQLDEERRKKNR